MGWFYGGTQNDVEPISAHEQMSIWKMQCTVGTTREYHHRFNIDSHRTVIEKYCAVIKNRLEFHSEIRTSVLSQTYGLTQLLLLYEKTSKAGSNYMPRSVLIAMELHQMYLCSNNEKSHCNIMMNIS